WITLPSKQSTARMFTTDLSSPARTRDYAEAKDAADNAARTLTELAGLLPTTSPLFPGMRQLRSIIHSAQQSLARQQQPQDLEKGLDLITTIEECLTSKPR